MPEIIPGGLCMHRLDIRIKYLDVCLVCIKCSQVLTTIIISDKVGTIRIVHWEKPETLKI